ncbi:MAG: hypothetical protein EXS67_03745 [Candidatus Margulisbacteria bacterium]|nr:hypothetical protein [Candidatus Margulisiibacteriota bacterium]
MYSVGETRIFHRACKIALQTLRHRYSKIGIEAGARHFSDLWLRDSFYASFGCLEIGDYTVVKRNLTTCLAFIKEDGQLPLRIGQKNFLLKYFGFKRPIEARYTEDKGVSIPVDSNSLFMIVFHGYLAKTKDWAFLHEHFSAIQKIIEWNFLQDNDGDLLIEEGHYAGWADSLKKQGKVLYTNVLHYRAVQCFRECCQFAVKTELGSHYQLLAERIAFRLNAEFWNGDYYVDWIDKEGQHAFFSSDGNLFAILFGLAPPEKSAAIQAYIAKSHITHGFSIPTNYPTYPKTFIYPWFLMINLPDYHNGLQWLWIGCLNAVTKDHIGLKQEAHDLLKQLALKILEYSCVYEVYDKGKPLRRLFYKSESSFAWSSGFFLWACYRLRVQHIDL